MSLPNATRWSRGVCFGTALGAAALLLVTPAWGAQRAVYGGTTSKDRTTLEPFVVRADARARKVRSIVLSWEAPCTDGETLPYSGDLPVSTGTPGFGDPGDALVPTANARGRFAGRAVHNGSLSDGSTVETQTRVTGRLAKGTARGAMTATATVTPPNGSPISCDLGTVRWVVSRRPTTIFGGATTQGEPVVIRLNRSRTKVADLLFGWDSVACTPSGFFRIGDALSDFPIKHRRFGDSFDQTFPQDDGGESVYTYVVRGTVGARSAAGRFSVNWSRTFTDGTPNRSCRTGTVSWRATTG